MNAPVAGCVLAGGKSRRMGADKALLEINDKPLITLAVEHFSDFPEILISAAGPECYAFTGIRVVSDETSGMGPIGGVISVLKAMRSGSVCFRPVDAPLVPEALHKLLAVACIGKDAAVPVYSGKIEPLLACFSKTALLVLEKLAAQEEFKMTNAFPLLNTTYISLETEELVRKFGDPSAYLVNANDPNTFDRILASHPIL